MTSQCIDCKRNFKILCDDNRCFSCFVEKWHRSPDTGLFKIEKDDKSSLGKG